MLETGPNARGPAVVGLVHLTNQSIQYNYVFLGKDSTWMQTAIDEPLPVFYRLRSILELLAPEYFDGDNRIIAVRNSLGKYLQVGGFCSP